MIASDKKFIQNQLENNNAIPPENEGRFLNLNKIERIFSAVGGAVASYAAAKSINSDNNKEKSWLQYSMVILGGVLALRGFKNFIPSNQPKDQTVINTSHHSNQ